MVNLVAPSQDRQSTLRFNFALLKVSTLTKMLTAILCALNQLFYISVNLTRTFGSHLEFWGPSFIFLKNIYTRLPEAVPQPIGLFLFCIEFGWGIIVLCLNLLVEVEIRWHTEFC